MERDTATLQALKTYIAAGQTYYQATQQLKVDGFSELNILNATAAWKNNQDTVANNQAVAESALKTATIMQQAEDQAKNSQFNLRPGIGIGRSGLLPVYVRSWWFFIAIGIIALYFLYKFSRM